MSNEIAAVWARVSTEPQQSLDSHVAPGLQKAAAVRFDEWLAPQGTAPVKEEAVENVH